MTFDHLKQPGGTYLDANGCTHVTAEHYLCQQLNFCGCGRPEAALEHVRQTLRHIQNLMDWRERSSVDGGWNPTEPMPPDPFPDGVLYFTYYFLDHHDLIEHGGSVPGWLTDAGVKMLADLDELLANPEKL